MAQNECLQGAKFICVQLQDIRYIAVHIISHKLIGAHVLHQSDIDECSADPCQNGAECINQVDDYHCLCADGYVGLHCEIIGKDKSPELQCIIENYTQHQIL